MIPADSFPVYARRYAYAYELDAADVEQEMWRITLERGPGTIHKCGPLFSQTPAYVATWAARLAVRALSAPMTLPLYDRIPAPAPMPSDGSFCKYLARMGGEWGIDVSAAIEIIGDGQVSPEFEAYIRELEPRDKRIAALLLSGLKRSHIEERRLAPRRKTKQIHAEIVEILKAA